MGAHGVLVSLLDFKSSVASQNLAGWVRFPHAPANLLFDTNLGMPSRAPLHTACKPSMFIEL